MMNDDVLPRAAGTLPAARVMYGALGHTGLITTAIQIPAPSPRGLGLVVRVRVLRL